MSKNVQPWVSFRMKKITSYLTRGFLVPCATLLASLSLVPAHAQTPPFPWPKEIFCADPDQLDGVTLTFLSPHVIRHAAGGAEVDYFRTLEFSEGELIATLVLEGMWPTPGRMPLTQLVDDRTSEIRLVRDEGGKDNAITLTQTWEYKPPHPHSKKGEQRWQGLCEVVKQNASTKR